METPAPVDISKLKSYGFKSKYSIEDTIKKLVNYYKKQIV
jgi:nucleoside-diphosphate-sugar epimerase